uniref:NADH-ubiquinone oxidoreductase chain 4L n=1 Tax=Platypodinae sp. BMNH 1274715 TaxID=2558031 RepID=A0A126TGB3_9CUCU|nr:NADH dehydrogenase subunit 4L [Platypodinae sp. BMNH 1274715]
MFLDFFFIILMFISGLFIFSFKFKHFLYLLIGLEFMVISLYLYLFIYLGLVDNNYFLSLIYLTFSVCEGALGLSILVMMMRDSGNDLVKSFFSLW